MTESLNGILIQPRDLTSTQGEVRSLIESIILASSNQLRLHLGLQSGETLSGTIPKFVTRKNPSLDNYFAELLLRTCYHPVDYLPMYEEHVIRGSQIELPTELNPWLVDSILIGIGGRSENLDFKRTYDEHAAHGARSANSVSQIVFQEHLDCYLERPGVQSVKLILDEINAIDSQGGASSDHLFNILKSLHMAQFIQPGFVVDSLEAQWKRAIIGACLMAVCVSTEKLQFCVASKLTNDLEREWNIYIAKLDKMIKSGYPDQLNPRAVEWIKRITVNPIKLDGAQNPSYLTLKKILFGLQQVWHSSIVSFLIGFLFESMRQAQQSFEDLRNRRIPMRRLPGTFGFVYYRKELRDKFPHRGLLARMNSQTIKALVVVHDPAQNITAIFGNKFLPKIVWKNFVDLLFEREGDQIWYTPTQVDGEYAKFILNGTESFRGVPETCLDEEAIFQIFFSAIKTRQL
jgi:hypothetical protein